MPRKENIFKIILLNFFTAYKVQPLILPGNPRDHQEARDSCREAPYLQATLICYLTARSQVIHTTDFVTE